jgi:hypothetical protein
MPHDYDWEVRPAHTAVTGLEYKAFPNREWTLALLRRYRANASRIDRFRHLLTEAGYLPVHALHGDALAAEIARGRFWLVREIHTPIPLSVAPVSQSAEQWAPPVRAAIAREQTAEPQTFSNDLEVAAMADALKEAAKSGVPFCEECERAKRAASAT